MEAGIQILVNDLCALDLYTNLTKIGCYNDGGIVPPFAFCNTVSLCYLILSACNIISLDVNAFKCLDSVKYLTLRKNHISFLPQRIFQDMSNLDTLDISGKSV